MELTPQKILKEYQNNNLDKNSAIELLISLVENSDNDGVRIDSIKYLKEIDGSTENFFKICENLLLSDSNAKIRNIAAKIINNRFLNNALIPMKWALQYESDYECIITVVKTIKNIGSNESKDLLINEIKKIKRKKYLNKSKRIDNKKFRRSIKNLLKQRKIENFSHDELGQIIINFKTIAALTKKFYSVYFELENALVYKLDLADVEYEVRGWMSEFKNNIEDLSEIIGLRNLKHLKNLNLSNNLITNIKDLKELENLTHLYISNNKISDIENINYIKDIPNLVYLDVSGNEVVAKINKLDFKNMNLKLKKTHY